MGGDALARRVTFQGDLSGADLTKGLTLKGVGIFECRLMGKLLAVDLRASVSPNWIKDFETLRVSTCNLRIANRDIPLNTLGWTFALASSMFDVLV